MLRSRPLLVALACAVAACEAPVAPTAPTAPAPDLALSSGLVFTQTYVMAPLPLLPVGINDAGIIAGNVGNDAARLQNGVLTILPRVPYVAAAHVARAINNNGAIAGGVANGRGLFWPSPNQPPVQFFAPGGGGGTVTVNAVNRAGVVVGSYRNGTGNPRAFKWTQTGGVVDITPAFAVSAVATDVNERGDIAGYGTDFAGFMWSLRWTAPNTTAGGATVLGVGQATAIRGNGDAAGTNTNPNFVPPELTYTRLWKFPGTTASALDGPQASRVDDLSELGRIVGFTFPHSSINPRRAWTHFQGATIWLATPNAIVTQDVEGLRVNRCGSIVGTQVLTTGVRTGLLWTKSLTCDPDDGGIFLP